MTMIPPTSGHAAGWRLEQTYAHLPGALFAAYVAPALVSGFGTAALVFTAAGFIGRGLSLARNARLKSKSTLQSAIGIRHPQITQRELSQKLGVSLGATNYVLRALLDKGAIKIQNFQASRKKLSYAYLLTPTGISEKARLTTQFLARKRAEYEALKAEIEAVSKDAEVGEVVR